MRLVLLAGALALCAPAQSIDDFQLPPKKIFDEAMPRYPNAWFYIDASLAPTHKAAIDLVTRTLRETMRLPEFFGPFDNPEACDFEVRIEHLQPWIDRRHRQLQHAHAFHLRYYYSALATPALSRVEIPWKGGRRAFWRFAASVHYEVGHANPNHADVEICPLCGRTGEYASLQGSLVEQVHDPLGLELLLNGTIRGEVVKFEDWERRPIGSVKDMRQFRIATLSFPGRQGDRNTLRIGVIVIEPRL